LIHPWLLATYVVLAPAAVNLREVGPTAGLRAWIVVLFAATLSWLLLRAVLRDGAKAAVLTFVAILLFFSYGHAYSLLGTSGLPGIPATRTLHLVLIPVWGLGLLSAARFARRSRNLHSLNLSLTLSCAVLLLFPLTQSAMFLSGGVGRRPGGPAAQPEACTLLLPPGSAAPDVYYVILDAYSRRDELLKVHGFDNGEFIGQLEAMGFYVAEGSQANYNWTELSLASSLNLDYMQSLGDFTPAGEPDPDPESLIVHSRLAHELGCLGYVTVAFETGHLWSEWREADYFLTPKADALERLSLSGGLSEFEGMLLQTSAARVVTDTADLLARFTRSSAPDAFTERRERDRFVLRSLGQMKSIRSPKLVFVHLLLPHPPFIFDRDGQPLVDTVDDRDHNYLGMTGSLSPGYVEQMIFLNRQLLPVLQQIVANSDTPPIIVIQGDHGYSKRTPAERLAILNAYLLPGPAARSLYPTITPVNTFRVILDSYFGGDFPLLPDASYWSPASDDYHFTPVPNTWGGQGETLSP
jgi:hypothetical protein